MMIMITIYLKETEILEQNGFFSAVGDWQMHNACQGCSKNVNIVVEIFLRDKSCRLSEKILKHYITSELI